MDAEMLTFFAQDSLAGRQHFSRTHHSRQIDLQHQLGKIAKSVYWRGQIDPVGADLEC